MQGLISILFFEAKNVGRCACSTPIALRSNCHGPHDAEIADREA